MSEQPEQARGGTLTRALAVPADRLFAGLALLRRGKSLHPHGVVHAARLRVTGSPSAPAAAEILSRPGEHAALVRFSRALGLPRPLPDLLGISIRVPDAYGPGQPQDLLLTSSSDLPILHHVFLPAGDYQQRPYSSSLPYRAGERSFLIGALPHPDSPRPGGGDEDARLARAAATGQLRFEVAVAPIMGRFAPVAELEVGERLSGDLDALRFNPWNSGGGLEPNGLVNRVRRSAYPRSQAAWRRARRDGGQLQDEADRQVDRLVNRSAGLSDPIPGNHSERWPSSDRLH